MTTAQVEWTAIIFGLMLILVLSFSSAVVGNAAEQLESCQQKVETLREETQ